MQWLLDVRWENQVSCDTTANKHTLLEKSDAVAIAGQNGAMTKMGKVTIGLFWGGLCSAFVDCDCEEMRSCLCQSGPELLLHPGRPRHHGNGRGLMAVLTFNSEMSLLLLYLS